MGRHVEVIQKGYMMRGTGRRKVYAYVGLTIVVSVVLVCITTEGLARLFLPRCAPRSARVTEFWKFDSRYGWAHVPNMTGRFASYGFDSFVTINAKGFRGREYPYTRSGRQRILVLGDSFTWGFGVDEAEMFTSVLEQLIPNTEVVNLGVNAYATDQELLLYEDEGRKYKSDVVIVVVSDNDFTDNTRGTISNVYNKPGYKLVEGQLEPFNQPVPQVSVIRRAFVFFARKSYALNCVNRYLEGIVVTKVRNNKPQEVKPQEIKAFPRSAAEKITVRLLLELNDAVKRDGGELLVVLVDGMAPAEETAAYLGNHGIASIVLDHYLKKDDPSQHLPEDFHWSASGHNLVGHVIAEKIKTLNHTRPILLPLK